MPVRLLDDRPRPAARAACAATERHVLALLDDELADADAAALLDHLTGCAPCRARMARLQRFVAAVRRQRLRQPPAPAALRARASALLAGAAPADPAATDPTPSDGAAAGRDGHC